MLVPEFLFGSGGRVANYREFLQQVVTDLSKCVHLFFTFRSIYGHNSSFASSLSAIDQSLIAASTTCTGMVVPSPAP